MPRRVIWTFLAVVVLIAGALTVVRVSQLDSIAESKFTLSQYFAKCRQSVEGAVKIQNPVTDGRVIVSLEYSVGDSPEEKALEIKDNRFSTIVAGNPTAETSWWLRAFYFNKTGQLAETSQELQGVKCGQEIMADLTL